MNLPDTLLNRLSRVTSSGRFIPEIDGLRFFAVALVVLFHLSGYLRDKSPLFAANPRLTTRPQTPSRPTRIRADGTVWAWGWNEYGQLGDGTLEDRYSPVQVQGLTGVIQISAGYVHSVALRSDGTVWSWGFNEDGELGDGTLENRVLPVQVLDLTGVSAIDAGASHTLAIRAADGADGEVWAWGSNDFGALGDGTDEDRLSPVKATGMTAATAVSAGGWHSLAVISSGAAQGWGQNSSGQLGDGTAGYSPVPIDVEFP